MSTALLKSKLYFPSHPTDLVHRPHLLESLDAGLSGKLTLVSAPAGFGKTTLVSEWVRHCARPVAWFSLDPHDNDLPRFLTYLITALQSIDGNIGVDIIAALGVSQSPEIEPLLTRLVNEIEAIQKESIMVLDDYHLIDTKSVHDALNFLIEYLPSSTHLVITGRADPPLPISRLRVHGEVNEIRTPDLRFTEAEVAAFFNDLKGFDLSTDDIATLEARTEGWIASLQLAVLSMHGRDDWHEFITDFSGSHRYIIDYLVDEVMMRQSEHVQTFLRRTSILEQFCAPLCKAVVKSEGLGKKGIIDYLERSNLFLIPLDDHREWYRYHHLFAEFLGQHLHEKEPEQIPELHSRASQWYEADGNIDEAIRHALAAGDMDSATRLVDGIAASLIVQRESHKLLKLVELLPIDRCREYPMLCIWHAWALFALGHLEAVEPVLEIAEANQDKATGNPISGYVTTVRAYLENQKGNFHKAIDLSEQALEEMSGDSTDRITLMIRGAAVIWLGVNHRQLGDLDRAGRLFTEANSLNLEAGNIYAALAAMEQSADLAVIRGQLHQAVDIYQQGLQMAQTWEDDQWKGGAVLLASSILHQGLGSVLYQMNDLDGAAPHIRRAFELEDLAKTDGRIHTYTIMAYLNQSEGDYESAKDLLSKACKIRDNLDIYQPNISTEPNLDQLRILLSCARPEMAQLLSDVARRVDALGLRPDDEVNFSTPKDYPRESDYSDLARTLIALDRASESLPLLERLLDAALSMGRQGDEIRYLVLTALAFHTLEDTHSALGSLGQALTLAEPQGYVRIFVDEGAPMAELLSCAISQNIAPDYARELLTAFPEDERGAIDVKMELTPYTQPLVEPLSDRELEVLRLMVSGCKYKEVAEQLVISLNTVRHHTRNIYSKLNVNNRAQAVARAKELELL